MKDYKFRYYWEHALEEGSHSRGVAYVGLLGSSIFTNRPS
ncbi:hypothetical protein [Clostridioides difficile]|nr:hypothetical protein [Clostridioides difficile]